MPNVEIYSLFSMKRYKSITHAILTEIQVQYGYPTRKTYMH